LELSGVEPSTLNPNPPFRVFLSGFEFGLAHREPPSQVRPAPPPSHPEISRFWHTRESALLIRLSANSDPLPRMSYTESHIFLYNSKLSTISPFGPLPRLRFALAPVTELVEQNLRGCCRFLEPHNLLRCMVHFPNCSDPSLFDIQASVLGFHSWFTRACFLMLSCPCVHCRPPGITMTRGGSTHPMA
jgi:hypothetical protein